MSDSPAPPPLPPPAEDENPPSLLAVAALLVLSASLLISKAPEITDAIQGPLRLPPPTQETLPAGGLTGRWVELHADEVEGTGVEQTTLHVLKVGPIPLPAGKDGARLVLVRTGRAYLGAYVASGVDPASLVGKQLRGIGKPWPDRVSRPGEVSALVLDTTEDEPGWFMGVVVLGFAGLCAWQLAKGLRRKLTGR